MGATPDGGQTAAPYVPSEDELVEFLKAQAVISRTERFNYLDRREAHWRGLQYSHLSQDWSGYSADQVETISPRVTLPAGFEYSTPQSEIPVRFKRPTAPLNLTKTIVERFTGLLFSEQRKPRIVEHEDADSEDWVRAVVNQAELWTAMRAARNIGGATGSVMVTVHLREGKFAYEVHNPKNLTVIWEDRRTWKPRGVLKMYTYPVTVQAYNEKGQPQGTREVEYVYRRIITSCYDVIFKPIPVDEFGDDSWEFDPQLGVNNGLGFFPGVWIQNTPDPEDQDGDADCEGAWQMMDTLDRIVSQMNKAALANLDPTLVTAVDSKEVKAMGGAVRKGSDNAINVGGGGSANYLEMTGSGIEIGMKLSDMLQRQVLALTRCVLIDPEKISGSAQSAKAIEYMFAPMTERGDEFRAQYGGAITKLLQVTEAIGRKFSGQVQVGTNEVTGDPMIGRYEFDLPPKLVRDEAGRVESHPRRLGPGGTIELVWGPYFSPTEMDERQRIENAVAAKAGGIIRSETATRHVADVFGVEDPVVEAAGAAEESEADAQKALASLDSGVTFGSRGGGSSPAGTGGRP